MKSKKNNIYKNTQQIYSESELSTSISEELDEESEEVSDSVASESVKSDQEPTWNSSLELKPMYTFLLVYLK